MFEEITGSLYSSIPLLFGAITFLFVAIGFIAWKQRIGPFYWRDAISAPIVFNKEGERMRPVPSGDRLRKTVDLSKVVYLQSQRFGDKFPAEHLLRMIEYTKTPNLLFGLIKIGMTEKAAFLPLVRKGSGVWSAMRFSTEDNPDASSDMNDLIKARTSLAIMREGNKEHIGEDFLTKYMPLISAFLMGILLFLSLVIAIQYISAVTGTHLAAMNSNTDALIKLINATTNCSGSGIIRPPA